MYELELYGWRLQPAFAQPEQDVEALMGLLQQESLCAHVPYAPLTEVHRVVDELRRMAMRFEAREAAFWLVEKDGQLLGRIGFAAHQLDATQRPAAMGAYARAGFACHAASAACAAALCL